MTHSAKGFIRWVKSVRREITFVIVLLAIIMVAPSVIRRVDPVAATADIGGYVHIALMGAWRFALVFLMTFGAVAVAWTTIDQHLDGGGFRDDWFRITPLARSSITVGVILFTAALAAVCIVFGF
jgi:hypothetical protein